MVSRIRRVASAAVAGSLSAVPFVALPLLAGRSLTRATELAFAVGTLALGFGLCGWSASVMLGSSVETMLEHRETKTNWTEKRSRRAMAQVGAFGGGLVVAVGLFDAIVVSA
jgi:hypothetical protein